MFTHKKSYLLVRLFNLQIDNKKFYQYQIQNPMISSRAATGGFLQESSIMKSDGTQG